MFCSPAVGSEFFKQFPSDQVNTALETEGLEHVLSRFEYFSDLSSIENADQVFDENFGTFIIFRRLCNIQENYSFSRVVFFVSPKLPTLFVQK